MTRPSRCSDLLQRTQAIRQATLDLTMGLGAEDQSVQSMPDASPAKWHLGHTTWFFETVLLQPYAEGYTPFDARFPYLFNSYYEALGPRHPRPQRGLLTRPSLQEVHRYRAHVDAALARFAQTLAVGAVPAAVLEEALPLLELGLQHEQQHQELLQTDVLHLFSCNPLLPAWHPADVACDGAAATPMQWLAVPGGVVDIGHGDEAGLEAFAFDNETPRHKRLVPAFGIANRLVTCGEYLQFVEDGGYADPAWWLSDGWATVQSQGWRAPLYWIAPGDARCPSPAWQVFGLQGVQALDLAQPVAQISFYEAAAYAEWAGARLPTEFEWEAAVDVPGITQTLGQVWQWTRSAYEPYPGFRPRNGAVREYNGKFMVGQQVLRGSSMATPCGHGRKTYRNFFPPSARWQFSGMRLARDVP